MGDGMKFEKNLFIALISLLVIVLLIAFIKKYNTYKAEYEVTQMPLSSLSILNNEIDLNSNQRTYNLTIDCSSLLKDKNTQIISYKLLKNTQEPIISLTTKVYDGEKVVDNYNHITSINTIMSITDQNKKYEQVFVINATCK